MCQGILSRICEKSRDFRWSEQGQDLVEYALLLTLISLTLLSAMGGIANAVNSAFSNISSSLA